MTPKTAYVESTELEKTMTPETAYAEAMKFENRANPYPFFDELRKTPVARVANGLYVVTGYRELLALAHDPRISSDRSHSPLGATMGAGKKAAPPPSEADHLNAYGEGTEYDRVRPARARSNPTPGDAAIRPSPHARPYSEYGGGYPTALQRTARQGQGQDPARRRRRLRLSSAGGGDLQDPGRSAEGRTHVSRLDP